MFGAAAYGLTGSPLGSLICGDEETLSPASGSAVREACGLRSGYERFPVDLWVGEMQSGASRRFIAVVRDISERKRAEQELAQTRNQYYHQEKMASIGQLAAGILHEVGNPIAAIAGAAQEMRSVGDARSGEVAHSVRDDVVERNLKLIEEHTTRLGKITREIAEFASPRPRERELFDLNGLIRSTARLMSYDRRFRRVELDLDLDTMLPAIEGVADQITQVLMNLLINAMDATAMVEGRHPRVQVVSRLVGTEVEVEVKDNGSGMDPEVRQRAREAFFTTKPVGKGTGLGLSLCDTILSAHGGRLEIDSAPGRGTAVTIRIPIETPVDAPPLEAVV
jgi:signal transduction histidine kinase